MDAIDLLLTNNRRYATSLQSNRLEAEPSRGVAVVTCMDARIDLYAALGLSMGEVHVLRNAGGVITDDVIRSLAVSQRLLGTREVMLIHHTSCGMTSLSEEAFRAELEQAAGEPPRFAIGAFADLDTSVKESIRRIKTSPFLAHREVVRGFVFDVDSGLLREIDADGAS